MDVSRQAMDDICKRYKDMVWRVAISRCQNRADAEDVFQNVFVRLVKSIRKIEDEEHLKYWLLRATVNCCNDVFKARTRAPDSLESKREQYGDSLKLAEQSREESNSFDPEQAQTRTGEQVMQALARMPEDTRTLFHLVYYEQLPVKRAATLLHMSEGTAKTRLSRARDKLRKEVSV